MSSAETLRRPKSVYALIAGVLGLWLACTLLVAWQSGAEPVAIRVRAHAVTTTTVAPPRSTTTTTTIDRSDWYRGVAVHKWNDTQLWHNAELWNKNATAAASERARASQTPVRPRVGIPTAAAARFSGGECAYAGLIRSIWQRDAEWAIGIAFRESRCQPNALNASGSSGLFQILMPLHARLVAAVCGIAASVFDAVCNVRVAWALYSGSGRAPWRL